MGRRVRRVLAPWQDTTLRGEIRGCEGGCVVVGKTEGRRMEGGGGGLLHTFL